MKIDKISDKQLHILDFVISDDRFLICDGAIRSGKTVIMSMAFLMWAMENYNHTNFGICGKTVQSAERNIIKPLQSNETLPYKLEYRVSAKMLTVRLGKKANYFYVFGGRDESSYMLIQGITLAGVLYDEVALMPRSFVEQGLGRVISYESPKCWFNCNPDSPEHWFYKEWIQKERPGVKHLHFLLNDNPVMTEKMISETEGMYSGVFYRRYILGEWCVAEGLVYEFGEENITDEVPKGAEYYISIDYGTLNPFSCGLWAVSGGKATRIKEYYYDGRAKHKQLTDEEYCDAVEELTKGYTVKKAVIDPSAASFITALRKRGFRVQQADNSVLDGIRLTARFLKNGNIKIHRSCTDAIREFGLYCWDEKKSVDSVVKENDHAMDDIRYFANTVLKYKAGKSTDIGSTASMFL